MNQLVPERPRSVFSETKDADSHSTCSDFVLEDCGTGGRYVVVDCGGGTVDITVHEIDSKDGHLKELFRATGGAYGSVSE
jgi:hypothetical protein